MAEKEKLTETSLIKKIERLSVETLKFNKSLIIESIGDDCAVFKDKNPVLVSSDGITENVHFDFGLYDFYEIGKKSLLVNLSDIAAMGGVPRMFILSLFIPARVKERDIGQVMAGIMETAKKYRVSLVGGNISKSFEFTISITIIGDYKNNNVIKRYNSKAGDRIYVSGELGNAWMAYYLRNNNGSGYKNNPRIKYSDKKLIESFINRFKLPKPRIELGRKLSGKKLANSLTDISDGLSKDVFNILGAGSSGEIRLEDIPVNENLKYIADILNIKNYADKAVSFGEDYELLWSAEPGKEDALIKLSESIGIKIKEIGRVTNANGPSRVIFLKNGEPRRPENFTFKHL